MKKTMLVVIGVLFLFVGFTSQSQAGLFDKFSKHYKAAKAKCSDDFKQRRDKCKSDNDFVKLIGGDNFKEYMEVYEAWMVCMELALKDFDDCSDPNELKEAAKGLKNEAKIQKLIDKKESLEDSCGNKHDSALEKCKKKKSAKSSIKCAKKAEKNYEKCKGKVDKISSKIEKLKD